MLMRVVEAALPLVFALGAWGSLWLGLVWLAERSERWRFRRWLGSWQRLAVAGPRRKQPPTARELLHAAYVVRHSFVAGGKTVHGALSYVARLPGAPPWLKGRALVALDRLMGGQSPAEALLPVGASPAERRLWALVAGLWTAGPETVERALVTYEGQVRRRAQAAREARVALMPLFAVRLVLRVALFLALGAGLTVLREGWTVVAGGWALYTLLGLAGLGSDLILGRLAEALWRVLR